MNNPSTPSQDIYDEFYFEHACGGHEEFNVTSGEMLPPWMKFVLEKANLNGDERVLDLGTGRGEIAYNSAKQRCFSIGLDYAFAAIRIAKDLREKTKGANHHHFFNLIISDARNLPFTSNQFDVVFMLDIVEHLDQEDLEKVLRQVHACLRPMGRLIIHTMPNLNYYIYGYPIYRFLMYLIGKTLPKDPRERFYHGSCHVNIQTPKTLESTLKTAGFVQNQVLLTQLSGSKIKKSICRLFPIKHIIANDIISISIKT